MRKPRRLEPSPGALVAADRVWYAAYGSNLHAERLGYYLAGGTPPGGARAYPGCRDRGRPDCSFPVVLPGRLYFALESRAWTGGMAFYDPDAVGETAARAYLLTLAQFSDIAAQEMYRMPDAEADVDLGEVVAQGRVRMGPGRYETLVSPGWLDGRPVVTFTAPFGVEDAEWNAPSPRYLRYLASGLAESHGWDVTRIVAYLAGCPGVRGRITEVELAEIVQ